jgi:RNA polymerase sigma-70 factor (ECF subfamily)
MNYLSINHPTTLANAILNVQPFFEFKKRGNKPTTNPKTKIATEEESALNLYLEYGSTHREIVELCKKGNRQAQFDLYRLYSKAMYNICLRMLRKEEDAEDLLQNSFCDVFTKLHTFRYQSSVGAWIKRIVVNNCINHLKKRRLKFEELDNKMYGLCEAIEEDKLKVNVEAINNAIMQLPDGYRVVFSLYIMEGYDHKEIAEILDVTEATSKSQYSRAKSKLRDLLSTKQLVNF